MSNGTKRLVTHRALPWALLAISLALNVFFVGGHVYGRYYGHEFHRAGGWHHRDRARADFERMNLSDPQREAFRQMRKDVRERGQALREANREHRQALWQEMAADSPDAGKIEGLLRGMADNRLAFQLEATRMAREFMAGLAPEQKAAFVEMARRHRVFGGGRRRGDDRRRPPAVDERDAPKPPKSPENQ